jgi:hypothetical protein
MQCVASGEAGLSRWLLRSCDLCNNETLPLTQELLARRIGVQHNAVSIVAHALQRSGTIRYSRGQIDNRDPEGLRDTSGECYDVIRLQHQGLLNVSPTTPQPQFAEPKHHAQLRA